MTKDTPGMGHNNPPSVVDTATEHAKAATDSFRAKVDEWAKAAVEWERAGVTSDKEAEDLEVVLDTMRDIRKKLEEERKSQKQPYDDAGKAVQAAFIPLITAIEKAGKTGKAAKSKWLLAEQQRLEREKAEAEAAAKAKAEEAAAVAAKAEEEGDILGRAEAEIEAEKARKAGEAAARRSTAPKVAGKTRATGLRTVRKAKLVSAVHAFKHFMNEPSLREELTRLANAELRAAGKGTEIDIPGFEIIEEKIA